MSKPNYILPSETKEKIISKFSVEENIELISELNSLETNNQWSDGKKFWADFGKSLLVSSIIIFITFKFLNNVDDERNNARYRYQKITELEVNSVNSFKQTSQTYLYISYDIYNKKDTNEATYKKFESVAVDQMRTDISDLKRYFKGNNKIVKIDSFEIKIQVLFKNYIRPIMNKIPAPATSMSFNSCYDTLNRLRIEIITEAMELLFTDK